MSDQLSSNRGCDLNLWCAYINSVTVLLHHRATHNSQRTDVVHHELIVTSCLLFNVVLFQKSPTPKTLPQKTTPVYEPPQVFRTDDFFRQQSSTSASNDCSSGVINGTVASSSNSRVSPDVPSDPCIFANDTSEPAPAADVHERTHTTCSDGAVVAALPNKDSPVLISNMQPRNDGSWLWSLFNCLLSRLSRFVDVHIHLFTFIHFD